MSGRKSGTISGIKNEKCGYIRHDESSSDFQFYRKDFEGTWNHEELMGKDVVFHIGVDKKPGRDKNTGEAIEVCTGRKIAVNVKLI